MLTQGIEVMKYIRASAGRANITVVFEASNQPRHDGKTIYLPRITAATSNKELKQLMASTDHEVAHDRFSCFDLLKETKVDPQGILMFVWNFLEDSRINTIEAQEYKGFRDNWDECSSDLVAGILDRASKESTPVSKITSSLLCWEGHINADNFPTIELVCNKFEPNEKVTNVLNNYSDRLIYCQQILDKRLGTQATYDLARDILKELGEKCGEEFTPKKKPSKTGDKSDEKTEKGDKEDSKKDSSDSKASDADTKTDSKDGKEKDKDDEYKVITITLTPADLEKFSLTMPEEGSPMGKTGINFEPLTTDRSAWDLTDYEKFIVVDYPNTKGQNVDDGTSWFDKTCDTQEFIAEYKSRVEPNLVSQENFAQQIRKLIQIRAKVQTQYGTKKGKLDQSRLSRICFNAPGFNERVFKTKIENKTLDAAITVLVDMSGSMGGDKAYYALASTLLLNEVCTTLNIPLEILGFTDGYYRHSIQPIMFVYKNFSDFKVSSDSLKKYFSLSSIHMNGNPDGENILWSHDRLIKRKEKKKIMIVMSDGSPAASKGAVGLSGFTKKVINEIEIAKVVDIYGLGLLSTSVTHFYKAHDVVNTPEQIPSKLVSLIERKILNVH
jgi:cobalamin biosynthesis protein CobT